MLKHLLLALVASAQRDVTRLQGHAEAVATHQLRVRMKKLLALLQLGHGCVLDHTFEVMRMHIRAVKNACAGNRDRVVRDRLVGKLSRRVHVAPPHEALLSGEAPPLPSPSYLRHQLCALEQLVRKSRIERLTPAELVAAHAITYRKGRRMMKEALGGQRTDTLHRWRHRVKELHYQSLALARLPGTTRRVRRARKLGSILGREHDLASLAREPVFAAQGRPWRRLIREDRSRLRERIMVLGRRLYEPAARVFRHKIKRRLELA